jgi:hypothetical protein
VAVHDVGVDDAPGEDAAESHFVGAGVLSIVTGRDNWRWHAQ